MDFEACDVSCQMSCVLCVYQPSSFRCVGLDRAVSRARAILLLGCYGSVRVREVATRRGNFALRWQKLASQTRSVLAQTSISANLIEDLPARAARENFGKSALAQGPDRH